MFYRAMTLAEFDSYGHQGWAPFRSSSHAYLDANQSRLVEVHLPGFVQAMADQGWFTGKVEKGCLPGASARRKAMAGKAAAAWESATRTTAYRSRLGQSKEVEGDIAQRFPFDFNLLRVARSAGVGQ